MITDHELNLLATYMVDTHGAKAVDYADVAVEELEQIGERMRADAWRMLRCVVVDIVEHRRMRDGNYLH